MKIQKMELGSISTNCYIVSDNNGACAIIDCDGSGAPIFKYVEAENLHPTHILLTHGHFDHIGAVSSVKSRYGCQVYACEKELPILTKPAYNHSMYSSMPISLTPDVLVKEGDSIQVGDITFSVMETPGHTAGSVCFIVEREKTIFSGDTLFLGSCGRTDFATGDWQTIVHSLHRLKELPGDYVVYPGHGPNTSLDYERQTNPFMMQ